MIPLERKPKRLHTTRPDGSYVAGKKGHNVSDIEQKREVVKRGVEIYGVAEKALEDARQALHALGDVYKDAGKTGVCGGTEAVATIAKLHIIAGNIAGIEKAVYALHKRGTKLAQAAGADSETSGGFVILGGGTR